MGEEGERRTQKVVRRKDTGDLTSLCKGELDKQQIGERRRRGRAWKSQTALLEGKTKVWTYDNKAALCINRRESGERKKRSLAEETVKKTEEY